MVCRMVRPAEPADIERPAVVVVVALCALVAARLARLAHEVTAPDGVVYGSSGGLLEGLALDLPATVPHVVVRHPAEPARVPAAGERAEGDEPGSRAGSRATDPRRPERASEPTSARGARRPLLPTAVLGARRLVDFCQFLGSRSALTCCAPNTSSNIEHLR
jgi:hypothetical protein